MSIPVREVSRDVIVKAAKRAIAQARDEGETISLSLARRLLKVARTNDRFLLGMWYKDGCGCLVGNLHGPDIDADRLPESEYQVGIQFDHLLRDFRVTKFNARFKGHLKVATILQVAA